MALSEDEIRQIVLELQSRPKHEKVRSLTYKLLTDGLGAASMDIDFEASLPTVRGEADALLGNCPRRATSE